MRCPNCEAVDLVALDPSAEMTSGPARYRCTECALDWTKDASGLLTEADKP